MPRRKLYRGLALVDAFHQVMDAMTSHGSLKPIEKSYTIAVQALLLAQARLVRHLVGVGANF